MKIHVDTDHGVVKLTGTAKTAIGAGSDIRVAGD
jgi:hypothetical protein